MNEDDIQHWKRNPVTKLYFEALQAQKKEAYETLTKYFNEQHSNVLLQVGKLLGKISLLDDLLDADLVSLINSVELIE